MKILLLFLIPIFSFAAEQGSPRWLIKTYFESPTFPDKELYYTGDMKRHRLAKKTWGECLITDVHIEYRILQKTEDQMVYGVDLLQDGCFENWYFYLCREDETWKLEAHRALALPGIFSMAVRQLEEMEERSEEDEWSYQHSQLMFASDSALKEYLKDHAATFNRLRSLIPSGETLRHYYRNNKAADENSEDANLLNVQKLMTELYLGSVTAYGKKGTYSDRVDFIIGGITDNKVGYMYLPEGCPPPTMSPSPYIYVEQILPNWYIFKTT